MKRAAVLIVEDHGPTRTALAGTLDRLGEDVLVASNGAEAMTVLDYRDDVALLVIGTLAPGAMDGAELRGLAIERRPRLEVLCGPGDQPDPSEAARLVSPPLWASDELIQRFAAIIRETLARLRG